MTDTTPPRQIVWGGPNGHHVILDEDGVTLRPGGLLEEPEINRLLAVRRARIMPLRRQVP